MTAAADKKAGFLKQFDELDRRAAPRFFENQRRLARGRFRELAFPTPRTEDWRFTSVAPLLGVPYALADAKPAAPAPHLPPLPAPNAVRLVFVNGLYAPEHSHVPAAAGAFVGSLADPERRHLPLIEARLGQIADPSDHVFTALNTGLIRDGAYVILAAGAALPGPVEVIYVSRPAAQPLATYPRTLILAGKKSRATVVERYLAEEGAAGAYLSAPVTEIVLDEEATIEHCKIQQESLSGSHLANTQVVLYAQSVFASHYVSLGGGLVRNETRVRFDGERGNATVNGLYMATGKQHVDSFTVIDHAQPHCESHELYKGILDGQSHGVFNGKIFVRAGAQKTDAKQTNKVLLLSDQAVIDTKPQLEIFADDVKCTHGATVGQLDDEQLFYLRTRGISMAEARRILTFAFANHIVGRIPVESLRAELEGMLGQR